MKIMKSLWIALVSSLTAGTMLLYAHPGHGDTHGHSLIHYLMEPMHAMVLAAVVLMIAGSCTWYLIRKKNKAAERA